MSETEPKKRGFFSKLFGLDQPETRPPEPVPAGTLQRRPVRSMLLHPRPQCSRAQRA